GGVGACRLTALLTVLGLGALLVATGGRRIGGLAARLVSAGLVVAGLVVLVVHHRDREHVAGELGRALDDLDGAFVDDDVRLVVVLEVVGGDVDRLLALAEAVEAKGAGALFLCRRRSGGRRRPS